MNINVDFDYYTQRSSNDCGPTAIRMAIKYLTGYDPDYMGLLRLTKCKENDGAYQKYLIKSLRTYGLKVGRPTRLTIGSVDKILDRKGCVIVFDDSNSEDGHWMTLHGRLLGFFIVGDPNMGITIIRKTKIVTYSGFSVRSP